MAFSTLAVLDYLEGLVAGLAVIQDPADVWVGIPTSLPARVIGIVAVAAPSLEDAATQLVLYTPRFYVALAYRLADSTRAEIKVAERALAEGLDQFIAALLADRRLGGLVDDIELDFSFANNSFYQLLSGHEARMFPVSVQITQQQLMSS